MGPGPVHGHGRGAFTRAIRIGGLRARSPFARAVACAYPERVPLAVAWPLTSVARSPCVGSGSARRVSTRRRSRSPAPRRHPWPQPVGASAPRYRPPSGTCGFMWRQIASATAWARLSAQPCSCRNRRARWLPSIAKQAQRRLAGGRPFGSNAISCSRHDAASTSVSGFRAPLCASSAAHAHVRKLCRHSQTGMDCRTSPSARATVGVSGSSMRSGSSRLQRCLTSSDKAPRLCHCRRNWAATVCMAKRHCSASVRRPLLARPQAADPSIEPPMRPGESKGLVMDSSAFGSG